MNAGRTMIRSGLWVGTASGVVLGLSMWLIEQITGEKVYTLLMNVDFIPIIGDIEWPSAFEWLFHLIISGMIGVLYVYALRYVIKNTNRNQWLLSIVLTIIAALSYIPLTMLAIKDTPPLTDRTAILFWLMGHALYAITLKASYSET